MQTNLYYCFRSGGIAFGSYPPEKRKKEKRKKKKKKKKDEEEVELGRYLL